MTGMETSDLDTDRTPLNVEIYNGEVVVTGPRVAVALTADAAAETARRLAAAASEAGAHLRRPEDA
ncbi:hypothetical protein SLNSH_06095 [Alsobacter soli]|uniref:Uncharacterized protein n=1 Tax=Alsobacter soli TaxID=2109933 RepID=A0A2T1HWG7_9HYPH|nr:hypothetical protein SLNSH_06095 [Alsobacter soli]